MRRRTTRGYKESLVGKLLPTRRRRRIIRRLLTARVVRSKALTRSARQQLATDRAYERKYIRFKLSRASTGRALPQLVQSAF